jgi:hypothetical protein
MQLERAWVGIREAPALALGERPQPRAIDDQPRTTTTGVSATWAASIYASSGSGRTAAMRSARRCCHTVSSIIASVNRKIIDPIT